MKCKMCSLEYQRKWFYTKYRDYCRGCFLYKYYKWGEVGRKVGRNDTPKHLAEKAGKKRHELMNLEYYRKKHESWRKKNPDYNKQYQKNRLEYFRLKQRKYSEKNRTKTRARAAVSNALKSGKLFKPTNCSKCSSSEKIEADHHDYNKPLDVTWLCKKCHQAITTYRKLNK